MQTISLHTFKETQNWPKKRGEKELTQLEFLIEQTYSNICVEPNDTLQLSNR